MWLHINLKLNVCPRSWIYFEEHCHLRWCTRVRNNTDQDLSTPRQGRPGDRSPNREAWPTQIGLSFSLKSEWVGQRGWVSQICKIIRQTWIVDSYTTWSSNQESWQTKKHFTGLLYISLINYCCISKRLHQWHLCEDIHATQSGPTDQFPLC